MSSPNLSPIPPAPAPSSSGQTKPAANGGKPKSSRTPWQQIGIAVVVALIVAAICYAGMNRNFSAESSWLLILGLLVVLCVFLGQVISGRPLGILVGSRNLMSLSRFQMVAWTIVILSAFLAIAFRRILAGVASPLDIAIDQHLWALLGISTASMVGTPLILQGKADKTTDQAAVDKAAKALSESPASINNDSQGTLYANPSIKDASLTDMFEGDEIGNTAYIDIAKVQMFLFTIIIIVAFAFQVYGALSGLGKQLDAVKVAALAMPVLSPGLVTLLGISHAGYLGSKTADHTPPPKNA